MMLKGLSVPSARREWLPARSTSTSAEPSLGRRGDGTSVLVLDKLTLPSSPHLSGAP